MVVHREEVFSQGEWRGINPYFLRIAEVVRLSHRFLPRWGPNGVENDPQWQQIIPFGVLASQGRIFNYVKSDRSSESRLSGERMLGVGGHLNQRDTIDYGGLLHWFHREWYEEIRYEGLPFVWPIGVIHDPSRQVSSVHLGFTFLLYGDELSVRIREGEKLAEAKWLSLDELFTLHQKDRARNLPGIDNWSLLIMEHLKQNRELLAL